MNSDRYFRGVKRASLYAAPNSWAKGEKMKSVRSILILLEGLCAKLLLVATLSVVAITTADALILCVDSGGNVSAGVTCKKGWTQLDPVAVGLQGPTGPQGIPGTPGTPGTPGAQGTAGISTAYAVHQTRVDIPGDGGGHIIVSKDVEVGGKYVVFVSMLWQRDGTPTPGYVDGFFNVFCRLSAGDASAAAILNGAQGLFEGRGTLNLQASFNADFAAKSFFVDCDVRQNGVSALESSLIAIKVDTIK